MYVNYFPTDRGGAPPVLEKSTWTMSPDLSSALNAFGTKMLQDQQNIPPVSPFCSSLVSLHLTFLLQLFSAL